MKYSVAAAVGVVACALTGIAQAASFAGPVAYLSQSDIPAGFYEGGMPTFLEDFEDGSLDGGITASAGGPLAPGSITDSVDGDDGQIDGFGIAGRSFFSGSGATGVTFTFATPVTAAAAVWTDGSGTTLFEAFGVGGVSLGVIGPVAIADRVFTGTTGEDRFFGVHDLSGITAIKLSNTVGGIEIDHVQYGSAPTGMGLVPLPAAAPLALAAFAALGVVARRRRI